MIIIWKRNTRLNNNGHTCDGFFTAADRLTILRLENHWCDCIGHRKSCVTVQTLNLFQFGLSNRAWQIVSWPVLSLLYFDTEKY